MNHLWLNKLIMITFNTSYFFHANSFFKLLDREISFILRGCDSVEITALACTRKLFIDCMLFGLNKLI
jgi:hypothetical protein